MAEISDDLYERLETFLCRSGDNWAAFSSMDCDGTRLFLDLAMAMDLPSSAADIADSHDRECRMHGCIAASVTE